MMRRTRGSSFTSREQRSATRWRACASRALTGRPLRMLAMNLRVVSHDFRRRRSMRQGGQHGGGRLKWDAALEVGAAGDERLERVATALGDRVYLGRREVAVGQLPGDG